MLASLANANSRPGDPERHVASTIIHGDLRFCHVLFDNGDLTGLIDIDMSTRGERWFDFCAGLLSGNSPERGNLLNLDELRRTLTCYHDHLPLGAEDQTALKATFAYTAVETLVDLAQFAAAGTTTRNDIESLQALLNSILESSELLA